MDQVTIGARLRTLRRWRGMTQVDLAGLSGLSSSFISMVESGQRPLDRRSHIAAVANALRVSETDLVGGPHLTPDPLQSDPHMGIPALRVALQTNTLTNPAVDRARPLPDLAHEVAHRIEPLRTKCDYVGVGRALPAVLDELHLHSAQPRDEAAHRLALETLVEACITAAVVAKNLAYMDLAHVAALRAEEAASSLGDPVEQGKAAFLRILTTPWNRSADRRLLAAERAASALEPHARTPLALQVLGLLTLHAALAAAVVQRSPAVAHWLKEARQLASRIPDDMEGNWQQFSATNVGIWQVAVAVERGESGGSVLELAKEINKDKVTIRSRKAYFLADVGRGLAREPRMRADAVRWLRQAEDVGPQHIRNSAAVRETIAFLLNRARATAGGRELRGMAARMGVPH